MSGSPFESAVRAQSTVDVEARRFIARVYRWMALGLALTGAVALGVAASPSLRQLVYGNRLVFYALLLVELVMVVSFSRLAQRVSAGAAAALFLAYAAMNGLTLSVIFLAYTAQSIAQVFFVSTGSFAALSLYGFVTKRDLTSVGAFAAMGLVGVVIAGVVNLFLGSDMLGFILACAGVVVFVGLTAYDTQKLKSMSAEGNSDLLGALVLYLDFVNLFLSLLRLFGKRR